MVCNVLDRKQAFLGYKNISITQSVAKLDVFLGVSPLCWSKVLKFFSRALTKSKKILFMCSVILFWEQVYDVIICGCGGVIN